MKRKGKVGPTPADFSDEELLDLRDKILDLHDKTIDGWSKELAQICDDDFDQYSFWGKKKLEKLTNKWSEKLADIEVSLDMIQEELDKRDNYNEQQRYMDGGKYKTTEMSDEEFLRIEQEKTERIREILNGEYEED